MSDFQGLAAERITRCHSLHYWWDLPAAIFTGTEGPAAVGHGSRALMLAGVLVFCND